MPVEKLSSGAWVGIDSEGNSSEFKTRQEARNFASGKYRATKAEEPEYNTPGFPCIDDNCPLCEITESRKLEGVEINKALEQVPPIHSQIILALESGVFNHSNIKAKNPDTGKVVKMTLGNGNKAYVSGIRVENIQRAMSLFSAKAKDIGATVLEWVAR